MIKNQQLLQWAFIGLALLSWCPLATAQAWKGIPARNLAALKQQAEAGEPAALAEYAHHSLICLGGVEYDQDLILDFFRRSAAMGNLEGQAGLAQAFAFSIGTARNLRKADKLSQQVLTTDKGHPVAQMVRGFLSLGYEGIVPKNEEQAFSLLTQAAKKGNLTAEFHLADAYYHGYSVAKDQVEARSLLRALHKKKTFPNASSQLLRMLREEEGGLRKRSSIANATTQSTSSQSSANLTPSMNSLGATSALAMRNPRWVISFERLIEEVRTPGAP